MTWKQYIHIDPLAQNSDRLNKVNNMLKRGEEVTRKIQVYREQEETKGGRYTMKQTMSIMQDIHW